MRLRMSPARSPTTRSQILAEDRGAPHRLDVLDHQFRAAGMTDKRPGTRIVHGVGKIPRQHHLEAEPGHLPRPEPAIQDADVGVDSHQDDLVDAFLLAEVVDLLAAFADTVEAHDVDGRILASPGVRRPGLRLHDGVVASAGGVVDREIALLLRDTRAARDDGERQTPPWERCASARATECLRKISSCRWAHG